MGPLFAIAIFLVIGMGIVVAVKGSGHLLEDLALSFSIGPGIVSVFFFIVLWLGFSLTRFHVLFLCLLGGISSITFLIKNHYFRRAPSFTLGFPEKIVALVLMVGVLGVILGTVAIPMLQWDERAIWGYKAKILYAQMSVGSAWFTDPLIVDPHPKYPLSIPILEAIIYYFIGSVNDRYVKLLFSMFYVGIILVSYVFIRRRAEVMTALVFSTGLGCLPGLILPPNGGATTGYSDVPLSLHVLVATLCLSNWLEKNDIRHLILGGLSAVGAVYTKQEGMSWALVMAMVLVCFSVLSMRRLFRAKRLWQVILFLVIILFLIAPWLLFQHSLSLLDTLRPWYLREWDYPQMIAKFLGAPSADGVILAVKHVLAGFCNFKMWGVTWIVGLLAVVWAAIQKANATAKFISSVTILMLLVYGVPLVVSPDSSMLLHVTLPRLLIHLAPLVMVLNALLASKHLKRWDPAHCI